MLQNFFYCCLFLWNTPDWLCGGKSDAPWKCQILQCSLVLNWAAITDNNLQSVTSCVVRNHKLPLFTWIFRNKLQPLWDAFPWPCTDQQCVVWRFNYRPARKNRFATIRRNNQMKALRVYPVGIVICVIERRQINTVTQRQWAKKTPNQMQIWDTNMSLSQKYENNRNWYGKTWTATILNKLSRKKSQVRTKTQTHTQELSAQCRLRGRFEDARERGITTNVAFTKIPGEFFFLASDFSTQISDLNCHIRKMVKKKV